jgi:hypothetical protein
VIGLPGAAPAEEDWDRLMAAVDVSGGVQVRYCPDGGRPGWDHFWESASSS